MQKLPKAERIRRYLAKHPKASVQQVLAALANFGVTKPDVSAVIYKFRRVVRDLEVQAVTAQGLKINPAGTAVSTAGTVTDGRNRVAATPIPKTARIRAYWNVHPLATNAEVKRAIPGVTTADIANAKNRRGRNAKPAATTAGKPASSPPLSGNFRRNILRADDGTVLAESVETGPTNVATTPAEAIEPSKDEYPKPLPTNPIGVHISDFAFKDYGVLIDVPYAKGQVILDDVGVAFTAGDTPMPSTRIPYAKLDVLQEMLERLK